MPPERFLTAHRYRNDQRARTQRLCQGSGTLSVALLMLCFRHTALMERGSDRAPRWAALHRGKGGELYTGSAPAIKQAGSSMDALPRRTRHLLRGVDRPRPS